MEVLGRDSLHEAHRVAIGRNRRRPGGSSAWSRTA
jgi:hypothetical protein